MTINNITNTAAVLAAHNCIELAGGEYRGLRLSRLEGLFEISLLTPYQRWEFYADAVSGEVIGVNAEPCRDFALLYGFEDEGELLALPKLIAS